MNPQANQRAGLALLALLAGGCVYFYQLGSLHIPKNGDEYPYMHIVRETAASGHWLPLRDRIDLNNTKPPLLFWQGMLATSMGRDWSLWRLRAPSAIYTLLTALLVFRIARQLSASGTTALFAAFSYLAFFSTYRYGRPLLTDSGMVFWATLPVSLCIRNGGFIARPRWSFVLLAGLCLGIAALYKSLAFVVPVASGLLLMFWASSPRAGAPASLRSLLRLALPIAIMAVIGGLVFSLWFALDPDPAQVFRSFILKENLGKFQDHSSYVKGIFIGKQTIWSVLFGVPTNAGLLAPAVLAMIVAALRRPRQLPAIEKNLWIIVVVSVAFFLLPGQRSSRYLLHVMPLVAVLLALNWQRLPNWVFSVSVAVVLVLQLVLVYLACRWKHIFGPTAALPPWFWLGGLCSAALLAGIFRPGAVKASLLGLTLLLYVEGSALFAPLSGSLGRYPDIAVRELAGQGVLVPVNFRAKYERYRFVLPGCEPEGYDPKAVHWTQLDAVRGQCRYAVVQPARDEQMPAGIRVLGERWDVATRHRSFEIRQIVLEDRLDLLFRKEYLLDLGAPQVSP